MFFTVLVGTTKLFLFDLEHKEIIQKFDNFQQSNPFQSKSFSNL